MSDYLWDRSGPPDPEVEALEQALAPLRLPPPALRDTGTSIDQVVTIKALGGHQRRWPNRRSPVLWAGGAVAAALLLAAVLWPRPKSEWTVATGDNKTRTVAAGELLTAREPVQLRAAGIGSVTIEPGTRVRLGTGHQFELQRGVVHAFIWAPAGEFVIDTPRARVVDLGCQYTLNMDEEGTGLLTVETGWVAFQTGTRESFIPAGAACRIDAQRGPGTPYRRSSTAVQQALMRLDAGESSSLPAVLAAARAEDGLTLWHLLSRATGTDRALIYDRLAELLPLPPPLRHQVMEGRATALDTVWNALQLGETTWWRTWKRPWPPQPPPAARALH
jgi:hypothetical protein